MIRRTARLATGLASLAVLTVIIAGVPYALVRFVGWPLPTVWPSLDQLQHVGQVGISETTVIKTLAVIVWTAWGQLAVAIAAEAAAMARRTTARTLPLLPGLQPLAARLIAGIALLASLSTGPRPALAIPLGTAVATVPTADLLDVRPASPDGRTSTTHAGRSETATTRIVTGPRDSWWTLAEQHVGDGLRWREIRDLNIGRRVGGGITVAADTDQIDPGWQLLVPAEETDATRPSDDQQPTTHTVEQGDHLWGIAEEQMAETLDRKPADAEVSDSWRDLIDMNRDRLLPPHDPDLIYPGQELVLPPADDDLAQVEDAATDEPSPLPPATAEPDPTSPAPTTTAPATGWQRALEPPGPESREAAGRPEEHADSGAEHEESPRTSIGVPVGLASGTAASALAAAGIVATLRWRRRRAMSQRMPGWQLPTLLDDSDRQFGKLDAAAIPDPVLDDLASLLTSIPAGADPVLVSMHDDGSVVLLFDDSADLPEPALPWELHHLDGGPVGWHARIGDRGPERSVGLPLLVTLGRTGTTTVFANVAAMRLLTADGPHGETRQRLRAMSLEAATSRIAVPLEVAIAGDDRLGTLEQVRHIDDPQAEIDMTVEEIDRGIIADDRTYRLVISHHDTPPPQRLDDRATNVGLIAAGAGVASVNSSWRLHVEGSTGQLELPDGGIVELALPDLDPELIDAELTQLDRGATASVAEQAAHPTDDDQEETVSAESETEDTLQGASQRPATEQAWCEVQILGNVQVVRDGEAVEGLTPKTLELLAYLATHRDGTTNELVEDAVWAGRAARGTQRIRSALTKLRDALGDGPDGEPLVPRRTDGSQTIRLSEHVGCDLDRALAHLAHAADLPVNLATDEQAAALALVRGEPFRDMPVSWTTDITQRAVVQLQDAARELAITGRENGNHDAAQRAIEQGLKLLDPCDALYLEWAELERARGRPDRITYVWDQLRRRHADDADEIARLVSRPAPQIELAFQELLASPSSS